VIRQRRKIAVTDEQQGELLRLRDKGVKSYLRERAAAILKVADGMALTAVAREGLLRPRDYETVSDWLDRFEDGGVKGLYILKGRGRKPAFSPSAPQSRAR
jgi:transposase